MIDVQNKIIRGAPIEGKIKETLDKITDALKAKAFKDDEELIRTSLNALHHSGRADPDAIRPYLEDERELVRSSAVMVTAASDFEQFEPIVRKLAETDRSESVRKRALGAMGSWYYEERSRDVAIFLLRIALKDEVESVCQKALASVRRVWGPKSGEGRALHALSDAEFSHLISVIRLCRDVYTPE